MEEEYLDLFEKEKMGTTVWSPLASGLLTGKYIDGMPNNTRTSLKNYKFIKDSFESKNYLERHDKTKKLLKIANKNGLTVNVSCETEYQAIQSVDNGLPTALVVKSTEERKSYKLKDIHGNVKATVLICPQQIKDDVSCSNCMLCYERPKNIVIGFKAHNATKKVNKILENIK